MTTTTNLDLVNALTVIRQLFNEGKLDEPRRTLLKDLVIQRNDALLGALELYATSFDLADLLDTIDVLLRQYAPNLNLPPLAIPPPPQQALPAVQSWSIPEKTSTSTFKVVIAGDGAVGKTCFVRRLLGNDFVKSYTPTLGVEVHPLLLKTTKGDIVFNLWDVAGQEKFGGLRDGYYIGAQAALVIFSVTDRSSYKSLPNWHRDVCRVCESIPFVMVGTKVDAVSERRVSPKSITFHRKKNLRYVELSAKTFSREQLLRPFWQLACMLTNDKTLELLDDNGQIINFGGIFVAHGGDEEADDDDDNDKDDNAKADNNPLFFADFAAAANPMYSPAPMAAPSAFDNFSFSEAPLAAPSAFEF